MSEIAEERDHVEVASSPASEVVAQRLRVVYAKGEEVKFISHQDEFRLWERTLRRAGLPLLYKQGFNPQPHLQFAAPLGVGFTGEREFVDMVLAKPIPVDEVRSRLAGHLPPGVTVHKVDEIPLKADALANTLIGADYSIILFATDAELSPVDLHARIEAFLERESVWRERERKGERYTYNLRPLVFELYYVAYDAVAEEHRIFLRVQQRSGATGRPDEVVAALGLDDYARTLSRLRLYFSASEDDAAVFAAYPVIAQEAIAGPRVNATRKQERDAASTEAPRARGGRSIAERAGDEFS